MKKSTKALVVLIAVFAVAAIFCAGMVYTVFVYADTPAAESEEVIAEDNDIIDMSKPEYTAIEDPETLYPSELLVTPEFMHNIETVMNTQSGGQFGGFWSHEILVDLMEPEYYDLKMLAVVKYDADDLYLVCEAGCIVRIPDSLKSNYEAGDIAYIFITFTD